MNRFWNSPWPGVILAVIVASVIACGVVMMLRAG